MLEVGDSIKHAQVSPYDETMITTYRVIEVDPDSRQVVMIVEDVEVCASQNSDTSEFKP